MFYSHTHVIACLCLGTFLVKEKFIGKCWFHPYRSKSLKEVSILEPLLVCGPWAWWAVLWWLGVDHHAGCLLLLCRSGNRDGEARTGLTPGILWKLFCSAFETSSCHELAFWICAFSLQPLKAEYVKGKNVLQLVEVLILFLLWWFETNYRLWVVAYMYKMKWEFEPITLITKRGKSTFLSII